MQGPGVWVLTERGATESPIGMRIFIFFDFLTYFFGLSVSLTVETCLLSRENVNNEIQISLVLLPQQFQLSLFVT